MMQAITKRRNPCAVFGPKAGIKNAILDPSEEIGLSSRGAVRMWI